jgi:phosphohistidine swiveling domain-containing protein
MGGSDPLLVETEREKALVMRKRGEVYLEALCAIVEHHLGLHCASAIAQQEDRAHISINELLSGDLPSLEVLARRKQFYFLTDHVLHEEGLEEHLSRHDVVLEGSADTVSGNVHRFRGMVACAGSVTGPVRVLHRKEEIPTFQDGEILVTAMTTPDYLPAVQRAIGIITDEGGVTCHAAIVARELGKPCLIGTKVATQVLRTGMTVELDANVGSVRILTA